MITLNTTTKKLQIVLDAAASTNNCPWSLTAVDTEVATSTYQPLNTNGTTNGTTPVDICPSPSGTVSRQIKWFCLSNSDVIATTVLIRYNDNGTTRDVFRVTLQVGDNLQYNDGNGFFVTSPSGSARVSGLNGVQGQQGYQGTGVQGPQGGQGIQGPQGLQGFQGAGVQGYQGLTGPQGTQSTQGAQGLIGVQGWQGLQGPQGNLGPQGLVGSQGFQGFQGVQGYQGWQGSLTPFALNTQTGTTYTLALTDAFETVTLSNSSPVIVTVPTNASVPGFSIPTVIDFVQLGTGSVTFAAAGGVTINSLSGSLIMFGQFSGASIEKIATDTWVLFGVGGAGSQGQQGFQGAGVQGYQGLTGVQGLQGVQGNQGRQGFQGNQGFQGTTILNGTGAAPAGTYDENTLYFQYIA